MTRLQNVGIGTAPFNRELEMRCRHRRALSCVTRNHIRGTPWSPCSSSHFLGLHGTGTQGRQKWCGWCGDRHTSLKCGVAGVWFRHTGAAAGTAPPLRKYPMYFTCEFHVVLCEAHVEHTEKRVFHMCLSEIHMKTHVKHT